MRAAAVASSLMVTVGIVMQVEHMVEFLVDCTVVIDGPKASDYRLPITACCFCWCDSLTKSLIGEMV
jgi:hypothetical protein